MASHSTSRGAGSRAQISFKASAIYKVSYKHIINILRLLTASSLVVSVMYWSNSSMTVLQREQVRSFLGGGAWVVVRGRRRVKRNNNDNFMAITQLTEEISKLGLINTYLPYLLFILCSRLSMYLNNPRKYTYLHNYEQNNEQTNKQKYD